MGAFESKGSVNVGHKFRYNGNPKGNHTNTPKPEDCLVIEGKRKWDISKIEFF